VKPEMSAKMTVARRRSSAGAAAAGVGPAVAAASSEVPQLPQNFAPSAFVALHVGHARTSPVPQLVQNFWSASFSWPHAGQLYRSITASHSLLCSAPVTAPDVIAVGDVMVDARVEAEALRRGGHVAGQVRLRPGGSAANAAAWARSAGVTAAVVGRVGDDFAGRALRAELAARGVEALLALDPDAPTGVVLALAETLVAERGATARLRPDDVPAPLAAGAVLVSGYVLLQEDSGPAAEAALERAAGPWRAVDAASAPLLEAYGRERFFAATAAASVLLVNEDEAFVLTDEEPELAARALADLYPLVCVKQGAQGAVACFEGRLERAEAPAVAVVDPLGAGDAFAGVLLAGLARGRPLDEALRDSCRAGAAAAGAAESWPAA
jgi:sugar/nucleoside kinase (ribokinase family)